MALELMPQLGVQGVQPQLYIQVVGLHGRKCTDDYTHLRANLTAQLHVAAQDEDFIT